MPFRSVRSARRCAPSVAEQGREHVSGSAPGSAPEGGGLTRSGLRLAAGLLLLLLTACGFKLRADISLPPELHRIQVVVADPYSPLRHNLEQALIRAGAQPVTDGAGSAVLRILHNRLSREPLTVGGTGRVREFGMRYEVTMQLDDAQGEVVVARQDILLERSYPFDGAAAQGAPGEEEAVRAELEREMSQAILRRIDAVLAQR